MRLRIGPSVTVALLVSLAVPAAGMAARAQATGASGTLIVLNKAAATASLIDLSTGATYATVPTGDGPHEVAVSPDGATAVVSNYGSQTPGSTLTVIDVANRRALRTIDLGTYRRPHGIAWLPGQNAVAVTVERDSAVLIVDVPAGAVRQRLRTGQGVSHMVVPSPDGARLYVANIGSGSISVLDRASGGARTVATGAGSEGIDVTPDGREVWVVNREENTVAVVDARSLEKKASLGSAAFPIRVKVTPDGHRALVSNARSGELRVFDVTSHTELATIPMRFDSAVARGTMLGQAFGASAVPIGILIAPNGRRAFIATANADAVAVVDLERLQVLRYLKTGREPDGLGYSRLSPGRP